MSIRITGQSDDGLEEVKKVLLGYAEHHPRSETDIYRQNQVSIRVRVVDPDFRGVSKAERHHRLWSFVEKLPEEVQKDISVLLLLTPEEKSGSLMNMEFEEPSPARL